MGTGYAHLYDGRAQCCSVPDHGLLFHFGRADIVILSNLYYVRFCRYQNQWHFNLFNQLI